MKRGFKVFLAAFVFTFGCYHFLLWGQKGLFWELLFTRMRT